MANRFAVASGNFNATSTWATTAAGSPGASVPVAGDNAYANSRTVTITANATCDKISTQAENGATGSGGFILNSGVTLTANVSSGPTSCMSVSYASPNSATVSGSVTGGTSANSSGITFTGSGTLNVSGNVTGGSNVSSYGIYLNSAGTLNITGNVLAGSSGYGVNIASFTNSCTVTGTVTASGNDGLSSASLGALSVTGNIYGSSSSASSYGVSVTAAGTVSIAGNCYGGTAVSTHGLYIGAAATVTVTGSVYGSDTAGGGAGVTNNSGSSSVNIVGSAVGGKQVSGAVNSSTGTLKAVRAVGNGFGLGSSGAIAAFGVVSSGAGSLTYLEEIQFGSLGQTPTSGPIILTDKTSNVAIFYRPSLSSKTLIDAASVPGAMPSASDVRYGVSFNVGATTGTCYVPSASSVAYGVNVDATTGTAVLTGAAVWSALTSTLTTSGSIGERLKNCSTPATTGQQLSDALSA